MKRNSLILAILFLSLSNSYAETLTCSSSDQKIKYYLDRPDSGTSRRSTESLVVNGETLLRRHISTRPADITIGGFTMSGVKTKVPSHLPTPQDYRTEYYVEFMTTFKNVPETPGRQVPDQPQKDFLHRDFVLCTHVFYVGIPRP